MIQQIAQKIGGSLRKVCAVLGEACSSFYHAAVPTATQSTDAELGTLIEAAFRRHGRRYGYRRIGEELSDCGVVCAAARIRRIMAQRGLRALQPKNFVPKTSDGRAYKSSPNLLSGEPLAARLLGRVKISAGGRAARGAASVKGAERAEFAGLVLTFRSARRKFLKISGVTLTGFEPKNSHSRQNRSSAVSA